MHPVRIISTAVALAAAAVLLAGCTSSASHRGGTAGPPIDAAKLPCGQAIGNQPPPKTFTTVLGVVALPASPAYPALQTARTGDSGAMRLFAKTGLVIKPGALVSITVPPPLAKHVRIGWGSPGTPAAQIDVPGCAPSGGRGWLAFAGGYWSDQVRCVPLIVRAQGHEQTVQIGVGAPCAGQHPPLGSSDT